VFFFHDHFFLAEKTGSQKIHRSFLRHKSLNAEIPAKLP